MRSAIASMLMIICLYIRCRTFCRLPAPRFRWFISGSFRASFIYRHEEFNAAHFSLSTSAALSRRLPCPLTQRANACLLSASLPIFRIAIDYITMAIFASSIAFDGADAQKAISFPAQGQLM